MRQHFATFSNFVCHFGEEKVLIDYINEIILPSFLDKKLIRSYGFTQFFFHDVELVKLVDGDRPVAGIAGKFVKNTVISREQVFDKNVGIVRDEQSMPTAPTAFFVLILNNHRLIYFPETSYAPDLNMFKSTILQFIRQKHMEFIDELRKNITTGEERITKKELIKNHPHPTLEIIPISGDEEVETFIRRYNKLRSIQFRLISPNHEIDGAMAFDNFRKTIRPTGADHIKVDVSNKDGLDLENTISLVKSATKTSNQEIKLSGTDSDGNLLKGDNHEFKIEKEIGTMPANKAALIAKLYAAFDGLVKSGSIKIGDVIGDVTEKIRNII